MKAVLFGATRGMGRSIARILAQRGERIHLLGIGPEDLERSARDLEVLGAPSPVEWTEIDLLDASGFAPALDAADQALGGFDTVVMTAALFGRQEDLEDDTERAARLLTANFTNTVLFCEEVRRRLLARGGGRLCVFRGA